MLLGTVEQLDSRCWTNVTSDILKVAWAPKLSYYNEIIISGININHGLCTGGRSPLNTPNSDRLFRSLLPPLLSKGLWIIPNSLNQKGTTNISKRDPKSPIKLRTRYSMKTPSRIVLTLHWCGGACSAGMRWNVQKSVSQDSVICPSLEMIYISGYSSD